MIDDIIKDIIKDINLTKYEKLSKILHYLFIKISNISQNKYYILGSFAIRKYREINDLDINLDSIEFIKLEKVVKSGFGHIEFYSSQIRWYFDMTDDYNKLNDLNVNDFSIEAFCKLPDDGFPNEEFSLNYLFNNGGLDRDENGHQFFNLNTLLYWKKTMNRPKDTDDIILIEKILKSKLSRNKKSTKRKSKKSTKRNTKKSTKRKSKKNTKRKSKK